MRSLDAELNHKTPQLLVVDGRGLGVRSINYHRHPGSPAVIDKRITLQRFNPQGQLIQSIDPRLFELQREDSTIEPNLSYWHSLLGTLLRTDSVDAGISVTLNDSAGRLHLSVSATGVTRTWEYEDQTLAGRLLKVTDRAANAEARITERFVWAGNSPAEQALNLAGQCLEYYDTAGLSRTHSIDLTGVPQSVSRQLLEEGLEANWQGAEPGDWQAGLASEVFTTLCSADAGGAPVTQIDAKGNTQRHAYDQAGQFKGSWLTLKGHVEQVIVGELSYSAAGKRLHEVQGNGVLTTYTYDAQNLRLVGIKTERPAGHRSGARILQDLRYGYDPVGNVLSVRNEAEATRFWRNQQIVAQSLFVYDSLYQLIESSGREMANRGPQNSGPLPPLVPIPPDNSTYTLYTRHYCYDRGGNLIQVRHLAPATDNNYTFDITVSSRTNRAVPRALAQEPHAVDALFDAGGHQLQLQPGQSLAWTLRGELQQASDGTASSQEHYRYGGDGMRVSKVNVQQRGNEVQTLRVTYLPGLELRTTHQGESVSEDWHTLVMSEGGRAQVRVLHWEAGRPSGIGDNQVRYKYDNLLGSSGLEVDADGEILSLEEYYPYGGTAIWAASSLVEADYKTVRYSGKERDATGLYYYGYRYYQPWACRWLSVDPAGTIEGLNVFRMVRNNPVTLADDKGLAPPDDAVKNAYHRMLTQGRKFRKNMFDPPIGYDDVVEVDTAVDIVARQSERNIEQLTKRFEAVELDARGSELMLRVAAGPYTIEHFSPARFVAPDGSAHFQSRQQLYKNGVDFNWENTTEEDVDALATDDFAFFSLSLKGGREKTSSAFGNYRYQADLDAIGQSQEYALMQTHDLLMPGDRPDASKDKRSVIAKKDKGEFKKGISRRLGKKKGEIVVGSIFMGADIKPGLAFSFAADFMKMGGDSKERIVGRMSQDANSVVQTFYRPQYLVPGGMRLHKDQYKLSYHS